MKISFKNPSQKECNYTNDKAKDNRIINEIKFTYHRLIVTGVVYQQIDGADDPLEQT